MSAVCITRNLFVFPKPIPLTLFQAGLLMKYYPSLNGLRAISIIIVLLFHLIRYNFRIGLPPALNLPVFEGGFGVNIFFVISGFLITSLLIQEEEQNGRISIKGFYSRRILRIFPAYFFLLFFYWILQLIGLLYIPSSTWATVLTYTRYIDPDVEWYTGHIWSLSVEENFYLFWPAVFLLGKQTRVNFAFFLIIFAPLMRAFLYFHPIRWMMDTSPFTRIDAIATGCYCAFYKEELINYLKPYWNRLFGFSLLLLFALPWIADQGIHAGLGLVFETLGILHGTIGNFLVAIIMLYSIFGPRGSWYQVLNSKAFNYIGVLSYSIYLWQQLFVLKRNWWVSDFPQNLILIFLAALFSHYIIEKPFLKLKEKFAPKKSQLPAQTASS